MDLISRQATLNALGERPIVWTDNDDYTLGERNQYDADRLAIETVPSADELTIVTEYCSKRDLVVITMESFRILQAYYNRQNGMDGE